VPYVEGGRDPETGLDCEGYVRWLFRRRGIELAADLYAARADFEIVTGRPHAMDVAVFRHTLREKRHLGIMIDHRWFTHCSNTTNGVAKSQITRDGYRQSLLHVARHKAFQCA
jgi:hypothetical protein